MKENRKLQDELKQDITEAKFDSLMEKIKYNKKIINREQENIKNDLYL